MKNTKKTAPISDLLTSSDLLSDFELFKETLLKSVQECISGKYSSYSGYISDRSKEDFIILETETGGSSGGNCWDDSPSEPYTTSIPKAFEGVNFLDKFLEDYFTNISLVLYKSLEKLVEEEGRYVNEYYGNGTEYASKTIEISKLFALLKESYKE